MSLIQKLEESLEKAIKSGDNFTKDVLRYLKNALQMAAKEKGAPISDEEAIEVLAREAKKRQESIASYLKAAKEELVELERRELEIIKSYLPEPVSAEELRQAIDKAIADAGSSVKAKIGQIIGKVINQFKNRVDSAEVARLIREKLGNG